MKFKELSSDKIKIIPNFIMMIGPPGSGKSTYAKSIKNCIIISSDDIREELNDTEDQKRSAEVFEIAYQRIIYLLKNGESVIFDATNLSSKRRKRFLNKIKQEDFKVCLNCICMITSYKDCIKNKTIRDRKVPEDIIRNMYLGMDYPSWDENWDYIRYVSSDTAFEKSKYSLSYVRW